MQNASKTGRKQKHFINPLTGLPVIGLSYMGGNRWRLIGTQKKFREADTQKAIARFIEMTQPIADLPSAENSAVNEIIRGFSFVGGDLGGMTAEQRAWRWFGEQVRLMPKRAAELSGVEQLAYLTSLRPPETLPTFAEIEAVWEKHFDKSAEQKRRVLYHWRDFVKATGAKSITDITPEVVIAYRDRIYKKNLSPKMQENIFTRIRRMLSFAKSRAMAMEAIGRALTALELLVPNGSTVALDPRPIDPSEFAKLLAAANPTDRAMLLLMLNGAYYLAEVVRLKWSDIRPDGTLVTRRSKEGRCVRVCVLWDETIEALQSLPRKSEHIFLAYTGLPLGAKGAELRFRTLRDKANVSTDITSSHIRDGAATAAAEGNVNEQLLNVLLGHRSGINDHYVLRNPKMVAPACNAVRAKYLTSVG